MPKRSFDTILLALKFNWAVQGGEFIWTTLMREKCPYSEFCWSVFSRIWTEYGKILRIPEFGHFTQWISSALVSFFLTEISSSVLRIPMKNMAKVLLKTTTKKKAKAALSEISFLEKLNFLPETSINDLRKERERGQVSKLIMCQNKIQQKC